MLKALFRWFDRHPDAFWLLGTAAALFLLLATWQVVRAARKGVPPVRTQVVFWLAVTLMLVAWRWPWMLDANELNADESQFIAGAITLRHDPVFFRSVDGMTAGPLVYYALLPLQLLGLPADFFTARLTALLLLLLTFGGAYRCFEEHAGDGLAACGILPLVAFFTVIAEVNFMHYSSELITLPLLAWAIYLLTPPDLVALSRSRLLWGGILCGLLPWAKIQSIPLGAVAISVTLARLWWPGRLPGQGSRAGSPLLLLFALLAPTLIALPLIWLFDGFPIFWRSYIVQNFLYVENDFSVWPALRRFAQTIGEIKTLFLFLLAGALALLFAGGLAARRAKSQSILLGLGIALTVASVFCVLTPRRAFLHYVILTALPISVLAVGCILGLEKTPIGAKSRIRPSGSLLLALFAAGLIATGFKNPRPEALGSLLEQWQKPRTLVGSIIHAISRPGEALGVWGYYSQAYVENNLRQATPEAYSFWSIAPGAQQAEFRASYLAHLIASRPPVFLDSVAERGIFFTDRKTYGYETFPALRDFIAANYSLYAETRGGRIYLRKDLIPQRHADQRRLRRAIDAARYPLGFPGMPIEDLSHFGMPVAYRNGQQIVGLVPSQHLEWPLQGQERQFHFFYEMPRSSYTAGHHSDGMTLELALIEPNGERRLLFARTLDPRQNPADRGEHAARINLPLYSSGAKLVLSAGPGPKGDDSWDWLNVGPCRFMRLEKFTNYQFPSFNRMPDIAESPHSYFSGQDGRSFLLLHAPSRLAFSLFGTESTLSFDYGFLRTAYENGGNTDGAIFRVEAWRPGLPDLTLFERHLEPSSRTTDRGNQHVDLEIPALPPGSTLGLRILSGGDANWDFTYITDLRLQ